jgi:hypothetical protein
MFDNPIVQEVRRLKPGEAMCFDGYYLNSMVPAFSHNDSRFTSADRVLENIIGASYEYYYEENLMSRGRDVTFFRLKEPLTHGRRCYVSPDRR